MLTTKPLSSLLFLTIFILSPLDSQAQQNDNLDLPEDITAYKSGYKEAPIIACPLPQKKYEEMLQQLDGIKQKIKSEACPASQISAIEKEVVSLEELIKFGRNDFIDLVKKGTSGEAQLSEKEVASLQKYIDQIVKKVASVTGLVNNPACFDEDEKVSTLSFLSSLIGDVSGAIGALTGPFGAKISIGGKLAAGLLSSIDTIVQARKTYDYSKYEDRRNYLYNLCAFYEFKNDLDKETDVFAYSDRLYDLLESSNLLLDQLAESCTECRDVINDYTSRVGSRGTFEFERLNPERFRDEIVIGSINEPVITADIPEVTFESKKAADMTDSELLDFYFDYSDLGAEDTVEPTPVLKDEVDEVVVEAPPAQIELSDDRILTIRALQVRSWVENEMKQFQENDYLGISDDARREVMRVQKEIELFLFDREGVNYLKFYDGLLKSDFRRLSNIIGDISSRISFLTPLPDPNYKYEEWNYNQADVIHDIFRRDLDFADIVTQYVTSEDLKAMFAEARTEILESLGPVRTDYGILNERCLFFKNSLYKRSEKLDYACEKMEKRLSETKKFFQDIQNTSFAVRYGSLIDFVNKPDQNYTSDWISSITSVFNQKLQE